MDHPAALLAALPLDSTGALVERGLRAFDQVQLLRLEVENLHCQLGSDGPSGSGYQHAFALEQPPDRIARQHDLLAPQEVFNIHRSKLGCVHFAADELINSRHGFHGDIDLPEMMNDFANTFARGT